MHGSAVVWYLVVLLYSVWPSGCDVLSVGSNVVRGVGSAMHETDEWNDLTWTTKGFME